MKNVVLGCTHYSLIKNEIQKVLPNTVLLDGCVGVAKEVKNQLIANNLLSKSQSKGKIIIKNSKSKDLVNRSYDILNS